eukprot:356328-Chlamydomonas_euryale.AAC.1
MPAKGGVGWKEAEKAEGGGRGGNKAQKGASRGGLGELKGKKHGWGGERRRHGLPSALSSLPSPSHTRPSPPAFHCPFHSPLPSIPLSARPFAPIRLLLLPHTPLF